jgi:carboxylesterase type B
MGRWPHRRSIHCEVQLTNCTLSYSPRCPQPQEPNNSDFYQSHLEFPSDVTESEFDCLNLFITRPSASTLTAAGFDPEYVKLPVYVYIHGGAYSFGAGTDPMWGEYAVIQLQQRIQDTENFWQILPAWSNDPLNWALR